MHIVSLKDRTWSYLSNVSSKRERERGGSGWKPNQLQLINMTHQHNPDILEKLVHNSSLFKIKCLQKILLKQVSLLTGCLKIAAPDDVDSQTREFSMSNRRWSRNPNPIHSLPECGRYVKVSTSSWSLNAQKTYMIKRLELSSTLVCDGQSVPQDTAEELLLNVIIWWHESLSEGCH